MNVDSVGDLAEVDASHIDPSEISSASPAYSGSSDMQDEISSVETTPPPMSEEFLISDSKRYSISSMGFSRSYRSVASSSYVESAFSPGLPPQRLSGVDLRPMTSGTDDGTLAAATAGLSFGATPKTRASVSEDIPPVPPLPQQYQSYSKSATLSSMHDFMLLPPPLTQQVSEERAYKADDNKNNEHYVHKLEEEGMFHLDP